VWDSLGYVDEQLGRHGGDTHRAAGDYKAARTPWQEALAIFEELDHRDAELVRSKLI
jgi:hypothetical protein